MTKRKDKLLKQLADEEELINKKQVKEVKIKVPFFKKNSPKPSIKEYDPVKALTKVTSLNVKTIYDNTFNKSRRYLINMRRRNKDRRQMHIYSKDGTYEYEKGL